MNCLSSPLLLVNFDLIDLLSSILFILIILSKSFIFCKSEFARSYLKDIRLCLSYLLLILPLLLLKTLFRSPSSDSFDSFLSKSFSDSSIFAYDGKNEDFLRIPLPLTRGVKSRLDCDLSFASSIWWDYSIL